MRGGEPPGAAAAAVAGRTSNRHGRTSYLYIYYPGTFRAMMEILVDGCAAAMVGGRACVRARWIKSERMFFFFYNMWMCV